MKLAGVIFMRKLRWVLPLLLLWAVSSAGTLAVESPIDESAVVKTGNLTLLEPKEIIVEQKMLHLTLMGIMLMSMHTTR